MAASVSLSVGAANAMAQGAPAAPTGAPTSTAAPSDAPTAADVLFEEGRALREKGQFDAACAKLEESQRLDPAPKTLFNLAKAEEGRGRFGAASRRWKEGLDLLPADDARRSDVEANWKEADKKAGHLLLRFAADVPPGTTATLDGQPLIAANLGVAMVVDPGDHRIVVSAPGYESRTVPVTAAAGSTPELTLTPGPKIPPAHTVQQPTANPVSTAAPPPPPASGSSRYTVPAVLLGGGVALAGAGLGVALNILNDYHSFVQECVHTTKCDSDGMANRALATNVLFVAAGAAGAAAVIVYFVAPPSSTSAPQRTVSFSVQPTGASLRLEY